MGSLRGKQREQISKAHQRNSAGRLRTWARMERHRERHFGVDSSLWGLVAVSHAIPHLPATFCSLHGVFCS